ncbi:MAG: sigma-70 family RNA polymerase sigma factor [Fuerstiella sp.]|nr:sigma-70 family RNA polymerase sigma factor [Fuerstiella sp.]MCP4857940.1 sigma-70 family RNA polymerase sigma factor [Fuerstiella sp.]
MSDVTRILDKIDQCDSRATEKLLPFVYEELRRLASQKMSEERKDHTLQATALVHEAFVRLVDQPSQQNWDSSRHFFAAAAEAMRQILIERARQRATLKRGGDAERIELANVDPVVLPLACDDILGLEEAIQKLEQQHPRKAELVKLRFFAGLTMSQVANALEISDSTAESDWTYARSWLRIEMSRDQDF